MDKDVALEKIMKCLRLSQSANEHEAAAALRQAQKLMELHRLNEADLLAAGVSEAEVRAGACKKPSAWETGLANLAADAFGCKIIFNNGWKAGSWKFIGVAANPQVAKYAFTVLLRQVKKSRAEFAKRECKRLVPASRTRRADLFCDAWVDGVADKLQAFSSQDGDKAAVDAYLLKTYPTLGTFTPRDRNEDHSLRGKDWDAVYAGRNAGRNADLNRGVGGPDQKRITS